MAEPESTLKRFRLVGGPHSGPIDPSLPSTKFNQRNHKRDHNNPGQPCFVDSILPLHTMFRFKFEYRPEDQVNLRPKAHEIARKQQAKIEKDQRDAEAKALGLTPEDYDSTKEAFEAGQEGDNPKASDAGTKNPEGITAALYPLGKDVTAGFPKAESKGVLVLESAPGEYQIVPKSKVNDPLNMDGALTKAKAQNFINKISS